MSKEYLEAIDWLLANETIYRGKTKLPISPALRNIKQRLEAIENSNPSEALKCEDKLEQVIEEITISNADLRNTLKAGVSLAVIKQALLKAQEQDFNYNKIVIPFLNELAIILGINDMDEMLDKIKEQKKVLEIIKEKNVDVRILSMATNLEYYNEKVLNCQQLTEEEFELVKRYFG